MTPQTIGDCYSFLTFLLFLAIVSAMHASKYYNLDSFDDDWTKEEFVFVILTLESLDKQSLINLWTRLSIPFHGMEDMDEEELIAILVDDVPKEELLEGLHWKGSHSNSKLINKE